MDVSSDIKRLYSVDRAQGMRLLFESYRYPMYFFALRLVRDEKIAEDIVQDCFVDFLEKDRIFRIRGDIDTYLFRAIYNTALNHIRKTRRSDDLHRKLEREQAEYTGDEPDRADAALVGKLYEGIGKLPEERRRIFLMIAAEGMKYRTVADQLGISVNTVKTQMKRAVRTLRELFTEG